MLNIVHYNVDFVHVTAYNNLLQLRQEENHCVHMMYVCVGGGGRGEGGERKVVEDIIIAKPNPHTCCKKIIQSMCTYMYMYCTVEAGC